MGGAEWGAVLRIGQVQPGRGGQLGLQLEKLLQSCLCSLGEVMISGWHTAPNPRWSSPSLSPGNTNTNEEYEPGSHASLGTSCPVPGP